MDLKVILFLATFSAPLAHAIVLNGDDATPNATAPSEERAVTLNRALHDTHNGISDFPYWEHVGMVGMGSGIYLGDGLVLTSAHVGCYPFKTSDGSYHKPVYRTWHVLLNPDGGKSDLAVFRVEIGSRTSLLARLGRLPIGPIEVSAKEPLIMIGTGFVEKKPPLPRLDSTFALGCQIQTRREKRWAFASLDQVLDQPAPTAGGYRTHCFVSSFHRNRFMGQAADGDSGGAIFAYDPKSNQWKLTGCIFAVSHQFGSFVPFGARTYMGNLDSYRSQLPVAGTGEFAMTD